MIENLTYDIIKKRLQIANSSASYDGVELIELQKKGLNCDKEIHNIDLKLALIDSIRCYAKPTPPTIIDATVLLLMIDNAYLTSYSIVVTGYGTIASTTWQGTQELTAIDLVNQINLGGIFTASQSSSLVTITAPVGSGISFNGTTGTVSIVVTTPGTPGTPAVPEVLAVLNFGATPSQGVNPGPFTATYTFTCPGFPTLNFFYTTDVPKATIALALSYVAALINADFAKGFVSTADGSTLTVPAGYGDTPNGPFPSGWIVTQAIQSSFDGQNFNRVNYTFMGGADFVPAGPPGPPITINSNFPIEFTGGEINEPIERCLTDIQIENILEKLNILCDKPCTDLLNFKNI
jgi:hypothetical protein